MKFFMASLAAFGIALLTLFITRLNFAHKQTKPSPNPINSSVKQVAILAPTLTPEMSCIIEAFKETLTQSSKHTYSFKVYNSDGDRTLLRSHVEDISSQPFDLLFTIGAACSQMAKEITTKREKPIPMVFTAVKHPVDMGIVASMESSKNHITGVSSTGPDRLKKLAGVIPFLAPQVRKVILICDPSQNGGYIEKEQNELVKELGELNIQTKVINVYTIPEITEKLNSFIDQADMVITLQEHTIMQGIGKVVELCNKAQVPLYSHSEEAAQQGASVVFGFSSSAFGIQAAKVAYIITDQGKKPDQIPITLMPEKFKIVVNKEATKKQNLPISPVLEIILEDSCII